MGHLEFIEIHNFTTQFHQNQENRFNQLSVHFPII